MFMKLMNKTIIVVEDDVMNRIVYQMTLIQAGAFVKFDETGANTIAYTIRSPKLDLIILDLMLPLGKSGFDVFESLKASEHLKNVPVVAVSAADPHDSIIRARELGFSGFISKPIREELFVDQIAKIIDGDKIWYDGSTMV